METETLNKIKELFGKASPEIKEVILSDDLNITAKEIGEKYKIGINLYVDLKNIIILALLGEIKMENLTNEIKTKISVDDKTTDEIIKYLDQTIFEKARLSIGTSEAKPVEVKQIKIESDPIKAKLREQLMNHPLPKNENLEKKGGGGGNREQLLEKLKTLAEIPSNEVIADRLEKIKEQIKTINLETKKIDGPELKEETVFVLEKESGEVAENKVRTAPYSKPPISYNIDPYREVAE